MTISKSTRAVCIGGIVMMLLFLESVRAAAQESSTPYVGNETFSANGRSYSDQFAVDCNRDNTSPYAGMDPLSCHGVMMPTDSRGQCSGAAGWRLLKQKGGTCYFCLPINPSINGIIIPMDELN
jgi:hypothetical protein